MDLRRHELVRLTPAGWREAAAQHRDATAQRCFDHWFQNDLPVVVATQTTPADVNVVSVGLPTPTAWGRARLALRVARAELRKCFDQFPGLGECGVARAPDVPDACVHGSFGWQQLTGLAYVREHSDLDLLVPAADPEQADALAARLTRWDALAPRRDGELCG